MAAIFNGTGKAKTVNELKYTPSGAAVLSFSFALNSGTKEKPVFSWYKGVLWGAKAEGLAGKIQEGTKFFISGRQHTEVYTKKDGTVGASVVIDINDFEFVGDVPQSSKKTESQVEEKDIEF